MRLPVPINFWVLCQPGLPQSAVELCRRCNDCHRAGDGEGLRASLASLLETPVAVELAPDDAGMRRFQLPSPAASPLVVRELSFGEAGLGHLVWDAGVALSIWLQRHPDFVSGSPVLELGSGVGIAGLSAALAGASAVRLTDVAPAESNPDVSSNLLANLASNAKLNAVGAVEVETAALDWSACITDDYRFRAREWLGMGPSLPSLGTQTYLTRRAFRIQGEPDLPASHRLGPCVLRTHRALAGRSRGQAPRARRPGVPVFMFLCSYACISACISACMCVFLYARN